MKKGQFDSDVILEVDWCGETLAVGWSIIIRSQFHPKFPVGIYTKTMSGKDIVILYQKVFDVLFFERAEISDRPVEMVK